MMKTKILIILILFICQRVQSQESHNKVIFNISYFGILGTHPGVKLGFQYPIATLGKNIENLNQHQIVAGTNFILYFHRRNQIGTGINFEMGYRNSQLGKSVKELMFGIGYLRTFLPNKTYSFNESGDVSKKILKGNSHLMKSVAIGLGKNTSNSDFWLVKPTLFYIKPYNTGTTLNFAIDAGYYFK